MAALLPIGHPVSLRWTFFLDPNQTTNQQTLKSGDFEEIYDLMKIIATALRHNDNDIRHLSENYHELLKTSTTARHGLEQNQPAVRTQRGNSHYGR